MSNVKTQTRPDFVLLTVSAVLVVIGILTLASVSPTLSWQKFNNPFYFLFHQAGLGLLPGIILGYVAFRIDLGLLQKWAPWLLLANLLLLTLIFLPKIGVTVGGASRWLALGPVSFQPSEILKLTFILYLSAWLSSRTEKGKAEKKKNRKIKRADSVVGRASTDKHFSKTLLGFLVIIGAVSLLLIFQPDVSTLGIIIFTAIITYFLAGTPLWHTLSVALLGAGGLAALVKIAPYRMARLLVFLKPETDPMGIGYQIKQALIGIGSGGIFGLGLGMSWQKLGFLPYPASDSIFAVFAEEFGFIGGLILISLFLLFAWQGFKIARRGQSRFSQLTAFAITVWLVLQAFINVGSMLGILPLTGIPLPFISYGGTALIAELIGVGILLNISKARV